MAFGQRISGLRTWFVAVAAVVAFAAGSSSATAADPVIIAAGDIACAPTNANFNGGNGTSSYCHQKWTSDILVGRDLAAVLPIGDNQYVCSGASELAGSYDPTWGRFMSITRPIPGNHEYYKSGGAGCDTTGKGLPYFQYFASVLATLPASASDTTKGYYSYDVGDWHIIALNQAENCVAVSCGAGSPQEQWLRADLAAHTNVCTLAYFHYPRFSSKTPLPQHTQAFWNALYDGGADVVLGGHVHHYERFAPQSKTGAADPAYGIREFVVGTGGMSLENFSTIAANSEKRIKNFGVLQLTLHPTGYSWQFLNDGRNGNTATDSGSTDCHGVPGATDTTPPQVSLTAPAAGSVSGSVQIAATASDNAGIQNVQFRIDGAPLATDSAAPYATQWDTTAFANGAHTITAVATDTSGLQTTSAPVVVTVANDAQAPTVAVTAPGDGATLTATTTLAATADDNVGVTSVDFRVDGAVVGTDTTAPYSVDWDSATVANGAHTIDAVAHDAAGNPGTAASIAVTVSNVVLPPTVAITAPSDGSTVGGQVTVQASAASTAGITSVEFRVDGVPLSTDTTAPYSASWPTGSTSNGPHTLTAVALAGDAQETTSATVGVTVFNDTTLPDVSVTAPSTGATLSGSVALSADASDDTAVQSVTFTVDGTPVGSDATAPYSVTWNSATVGNGPHTVAAIATDTSNNSRTSDGVGVTVGNVAPAGIARRASSTSFGSTGTPSVTIPATTQAGDVVVVAISTSRSSTIFATPPAGWTLVRSAAAVDFSSAVFVKVAGPGDAGTAVTFTTNSTTDYWTAGAIAYSGVDQANPVVGSSVIAPTSQVQSVQPAAVAVPAGAMAVAIASADVSSARTWTQDAGSEVFDLQPTAITLVANDQAAASAGSVTRTLTISGAVQELTGYLVALRPAS